MSTDLPESKSASNVKVSFDTSQIKIAAASVKGGEYREKDNKLVWIFKKVVSGSELRLSATLSLRQPLTHRNFQPIQLEFEIPMYNVSYLKVRYLRILNTGGRECFRWVRYMTLADSYTARIPN